MKKVTCYLIKSDLDENTRTQVRILLPALIADQAVSVLMPIVNTAMTAYADTTILAGMSLASSVCNVLTAIISALTIGSTVLGAQLHGKKDKTALSALVTQTGFYGTILSAAIALLCILASSAVHSVLFPGSEPAVQAASEVYFKWSAASLPFVFITSHISGLFRSSGAPQKPLITGIFTNGINIILGYILIIGIFDGKGLGVTGAGITIFSSRLAGALLSMAFAVTTSLPIKLKLKREYLGNVFYLKEALPIGIASASENLLYYTGRMLLSSIISSIGVIAIAANQLVLSIHQFAIIIPTAFSTAAFTVIGQAFGRKDEDCCIRLEHYLGHASQYICMATAVFLVVFSRPVCSLFTSDPDLINAAVPALFIETLSLLCWTRAVIPGVAVKSCGHYTYPFIVNSATMWVFQVAFVYFIAKPYGASGVWTGYLLSTAVRALLYLIYLGRNRWASHAAR